MDITISKCKLVDALPKHITCKRCRFIPTDPMKTECGHLYCRECVMNKLKWSEKCTCGGDITSPVPAPPEIHYQIGALRVHCPFKECDYTGPYSELLETHA